MRTGPPSLWTGNVLQEEVKVFGLRASKSMVCRAGYNRTHITYMAAVAGDGSQLPPSFFLEERHIARWWYNRATILLCLPRTGTGCSSTETCAD